MYTPSLRFRAAILLLFAATALRAASFARRADAIVGAYTSQGRFAEAGAGGIHTTVRDLLRWDSALYTDTLAPRPFIDRIFTANNKGNYGYGWFVTADRDGKRIWHEGSDPGFAAFIVRRPAQHLFVIVLANIEDAPVREIAGKLEELALGRATR